MTPGSTRQMRSAGRMSRMRFSRFRASTTPPGMGTAPPDRLVPEPRAMHGVPVSWHQRTAATTSSVESTSTTAPGRSRNAVRPSDSNGVRWAAVCRTRSGDTMAWRPATICAWDRGVARPSQASAAACGGFMPPPSPGCDRARPGRDRPFRSVRNSASGTPLGHGVRRSGPTTGPGP